MNFSRFTPARFAGGLLLAAALFGCESMGPVSIPGEIQNTRLNVVADQVAQAEKDRAAQGRAPALGSSAIPNSAFYTVEQIPYQAGPRDLANTAAIGDDVVENNVPIGFDFTFYGNTYSTLQVSSNGFLRFDPANNNSGCCSGRPIPLNDLWNNIIAFAWTDLVPTGGTSGILRYETRGTAPNRQFILHVDSVRIFGNPAPNRNVSQWVMLREGSNNIEIHTEFLTPQAQAVTQGIENADGTDAAFVQGRVAATFSLTNDGVRFSPMQTTNVDIFSVFSGPPNRGRDTIVTNDPDVFVQILNIEQFLGRSATANNVRIGSSYETGVPAEAFTILDINNDGNRDIQVRFSAAALNLSVGTQTIQVWGRDPTTGETFRGTRQVNVIAPPPGGMLFNNGGIVTHPGGGTGPIAGANVSMSSPAPFNTAGSNARLIPPGPEFRIIDDFTVPSGGWTVGSIVTHAYRTGGAPDWTGANLNIRSGAPDGPIVATATTTTWTFTGIYRTFNGVLNDANRPVHAIRFDLGSLNLAAGTYWIDWQVVGPTSGWAPYVMQPDPTGGNNTITVFNNGRHLTPLGIEPLLDPPGAETPFIVFAPGGASAPASRAPVMVRQPLQLSPEQARAAHDRVR